MSTKTNIYNQSWITSVNDYYTSVTNAYVDTDGTTGTRYILNGSTGTGFYRTGYDFLGWNPSSTATTATYKPGESIPTSTYNGGNLTLYAVWTPHIYKVTYLNEDGSVYKTDYVAYNEEVSLEVGTPETSKGEEYDFVGWNVYGNRNTKTVINSMLAGSTVKVSSIARANSLKYYNSLSPIDLRTTAFNSITNSSNTEIVLYPVFSLAASDVDNTQNTQRYTAATAGSGITSDVIRGMYLGYTKYLDTSFNFMTRADILIYDYVIANSKVTSMFGVDSSSFFYAIAAYDNAGNSTSAVSNYKKPDPDDPETTDPTPTDPDDPDVPENNPDTPVDPDPTPTPDPDPVPTVTVPKSYKQTVYYKLVDYATGDASTESTLEDTILEGKTFTVTAKAVDGYELAYWTYSYSDGSKMLKGTKETITASAFPKTITVHSAGSFTLYYMPVQRTLTLDARGAIDGSGTATSAYFAITEAMTKNADGTWYDPDTEFTIAADQKTAYRKYYSGQTLTAYPKPVMYGYANEHYTFTQNGAYDTATLDAIKSKLPSYITNGWWDYVMNDDGSYLLDEANGYERVVEWDLDSVATKDTVIYESPKAMPDGDLTVYMQWTPTKFRVWYDAAANGNGGGYISASAPYADFSGYTSAYVDTTFNTNVDLTSIKATKHPDNDNGTWVFVGWNTNPNATTGLTSLKVTEYNLNTLDSAYSSPDTIILYAIYKKTFDVAYTDFNSTKQAAQTTHKYYTVYNTTTTLTIKAKDSIAARKLTYKNNETGETSTTTWRSLGWSNPNDLVADADIAVLAGNDYDIDCTQKNDYYHLYALYDVDVTISYVTNSIADIEDDTGRAYYNAAGNEKLADFTLPDAPYGSGMSFVCWVQTLDWPNCTVCGNDCQELATEDTSVNGCQDCKCFYPGHTIDTGCTCCLAAKEDFSTDHDMTYTVRWDAFPFIEPGDVYFALDEVNSITEADLLVNTISHDNEDVTTTIHVRDLTTVLNELKSLDGDGSLDIVLTTTDSFNNTTISMLTAHVTDTTPKDPDVTVYTRFLSSAYYMEDDGTTLVAPENGGLEITSLWTTRDTLMTKLSNALANADAAKADEDHTTVTTFYYTYDEVQEIKEYNEANGYGKYTDSSLLQKFIEKFMKK